MVKVLVVEDEASIREMIALNLRLGGMGGGGGREAGGAARARGPRQQGERGHGARARLLGMGGRPHGRGGVGGRSPAHKPVTPEAVRSEAVEANLRSLFCERPGRHTRAQTVGST